MSFPPLYVISVSSADTRRRFMKEQLDALGIQFEFFDAVYGREEPEHPLFSKYDDQERLRRRGPGTSMTPAQLGCYASHYLLWQKCVELGRPIIILEDDAVLQKPAFTDFHNNADDFAQAYGLVWMQPDTRKEHRDVALGQFKGFAVKKFARGASGTTGYLIGPKAAQTLLDYSATWIYPVDTAMKRFYEHGVEAYGIDPVCVRHHGELESYIGADAPKVQRTLWQRLRREWFTLSDKRRRVQHNMAFRLQHRRKHKQTVVSDDYAMADRP